MVLSWLCRDYPARLPSWMPWDFSWLEFLAFAVTLWWYGLGLSCTPRPLRPSRTRQLLVLAGLFAIYAVLQTRFEYAAEHMFCLNRVQHLILHHLGPFLIALGWPGRTIRRGMPGTVRRLFGASIVRRTVAVLRQPVIAGTIFVGLIFLWLVPAVHFRAMINPRLYAVMNWSMLLDGLLFWCLVMDPRRIPPARLSRASGILLSLAVQVPQIAGGAFIGFANHSYYAYYDLCGRLLPSVSAVLDQEIGGSVIWLGGGMMSAAAALVLFERIWRDETAQPALQAGD
jgi:putative membrane protein